MPGLVASGTPYIIKENWFNGNIKLHNPKYLKNNLQKSYLTEESYEEKITSTLEEDMEVYRGSRNIALIIL
jgi:hypothetical protein